MMKETIILTIPINDFKLIVMDAVDACLNNASSGNYFHQGKTEQQEIIDRSELRRRLSVSNPTIIRWEKKGIIPTLRIGSAVRYNWPAVVSSLENRRVA